MARTTTSSVSVDLSFAWTETGTNQTVTEQSNTKLSSSLSQGTAAAQINAAWRGTGVIATSGQLVLDFESLDRKVFGSSQTVDFVGGDIKSIVIANFLRLRYQKQAAIQARKILDGITAFFLPMLWGWAKRL